VTQERKGPLGKGEENLKKGGEGSGRPFQKDVLQMLLDKRPTVVQKKKNSIVGRGSNWGTKN